MMPEKHIDALAGWAGDMQSLIDDCFSYAKRNQAKTIVDYFTKYLGDNDQRCGIDDLNADAVNIAYEILSEDFNDLNSVLTQYYTTGVSKRYTTFIKTALNDSEKTIEPYTQTHYIIFRLPILDDDVKISSD